MGRQHHEQPHAHRLSTAAELAVQQRDRQQMGRALLGGDTRQGRRPPNVNDMSQESAMVQVTARLPDALGVELDTAAKQLHRYRADIIRQAIEYYLDDGKDRRPERPCRPRARLGGSA